jgi:phage terminase large subunit GpA-like protein
MFTAVEIAPLDETSGVGEAASERPTAEELAAGASFPPGTVHLPAWVDAEWLKQFAVEQLVTVKTKRGFAKLEWQKLRERNEALDARVYARAAAWIAGLDRWSEERWAEAEADLRIVPASPAFRPSPASRRTSARKQRAGTYLFGSPLTQ